MLRGGWFLWVVLTCMGMAGCRHVAPPERGSAGGEAPVTGTTSTVATAASGPLKFVVSFPTSVRTAPATGRCLLFLARKGSDEPRFGGGFFDLHPVFAIDVTNLAPGAELVFSPDRFRAPDALAFPTGLDGLEAGSYRAQAILDLDATERDHNAGPGNLYSGVMRCALSGVRGGTFRLSADRVVTNAPVADTDWVKHVEVRSRLLSSFHGRDILLRAAVVLPAGYQSNQTARFPAVFVIPGFGGRHLSAWPAMKSDRGRKWMRGQVPFPHVRVVVDPDMPLGHSVFANSANNGPVGDALVQELIPEIERRFRVVPEARGRFVTGHSSGGWASLWLQVAYPDFFGGCWSTAPDPVDFRAFQTMNIYEDRNGHWTREGLPRPVARGRDQARLSFVTLNHWEYVIGYGSQLDSFDAVFGPRGADGRPRRLMDKLTGTIDREVADHWRRYDIRAVLEKDWATLGPKLRGKLHVIAAGWDTFYLDAAAELLGDFLRGTGHGGYVEILPGAHGSVVTDAVRERIENEMARQYRAGGEAR